MADRDVGDLRPAVTMSFRTFASPVPTQQPLFHDGWRAWAIGAGLGAVAQIVVIGRIGTWFLDALCHEMGHSAVGILTGSPSFPAIRLDGHAAASIGERVPVMALAVIGFVAWWAWQARRVALQLALRIACLVPLILAFLFGGFRETLILYAGQFGELLFAGIFLWRAYTGGFTEQPAERPLYAALGLLFVWRNVALAGGLIFSASARATYHSNGSFGGENDLVRIARDHLGTSLPMAAAPLLLAALATPVLAWWLGRMYRDARAEARASRVHRCQVATTTSTATAPE